MDGDAELRAGGRRRLLGRSFASILGIGTRMIPFDSVLLEKPRRPSPPYSPMTLRYSSLRIENAASRKPPGRSVSVSFVKIVTVRCRRGMQYPVWNFQCLLSLVFSSN